MAGLSTRLFPTIEAVFKEFLSIINKPLIHYTVEEANAANLDILFLLLFEKNEQ